MTDEISADHATLCLANATLDALRVTARWYRREMCDILLPLVEGQQVVTEMQRISGAASIVRDEAMGMRDDIAQIEVELKRLSAFAHGLAEQIDKLNLALSKARDAWPKVVAMANRNGLNGVKR